MEHAAPFLRMSMMRGHSFRTTKYLAFLGKSQSYAVVGNPYNALPVGCSVPRDTH